MTKSAVSGIAVCQCTFGCSKCIGLKAYFVDIDAIFKVSSENGSVILDSVDCTYSICEGCAQAREIKAGNGQKTDPESWNIESLDSKISYGNKSFMC